ncbi:MAG TPA: hypothetical protein VJ770_20450 [Stellaceae bacterium]|nr:hypothetical protein [Stellaceae bacterium]
MPRKEIDFAALEQRMREAVRHVPPGPDQFWRIDACLGELVAKETGIWKPGGRYTVLGYARRIHDLDERLRRIERHLKLDPPAD